MSPRVPKPPHFQSPRHSVLPRLLVLPLLILLPLSSAIPALAAVAEPASELRSFVTTFYLEGVPRERAKAFGVEALPELEALLRDTALQPYWTNVVLTMGYIGEARSVAPLRELVERQEGEISVQAFRAVLTAFTALGHLAQAGDDESLAILLAEARGEEKKGPQLRFSYGPYSDEALRELLARVCIQALGISGRSEAHAQLAKMVADATLRPDWVDDVTEAIDLNEKVRALGAARALATGDQP